MNDKLIKSEILNLFTQYESKSKTDFKIDIENDLDLCYIASPLRGNVEYNLMLAREHCHFVSKVYKMTPIATHILFPAMGFDDDNDFDRMLCRAYGLKILGMCKHLFFFVNKSNPIVSEGMNAEIDLAFQLLIDVQKIQYTYDPITKKLEYYTL